MSPVLCQRWWRRNERTGVREGGVVEGKRRILRSTIRHYLDGSCPIMTRLLRASFAPDLACDPHFAEKEGRHRVPIIDQRAIHVT